MCVCVCRRARVRVMRARVRACGTVCMRTHASVCVFVVCVRARDFVCVCVSRMTQHSLARQLQVYDVGSA